MCVQNTEKFENDETTTRNGAEMQKIFPKTYDKIVEPSVSKSEREREKGEREIGKKDNGNVVNLFR